MSEPWADVATGEEAAVYAYGVLTPLLGEKDRNAAISAATAHARARDTARDALAGLDKNPPMPVAYEIPFDLNDEATAKKLAALCEIRLVNVYATLASQVQGQERLHFSQASQECSVRAVLWGQRPSAFPGAGRDQDMIDPSGTASRSSGSLPATSDTPASAPPAPSSAPGSDGATLE